MGVQLGICGGMQLGYAGSYSNALKMGFLGCG